MTDKPQFGRGQTETRLLKELCTIDYGFAFDSSRFNEIGNGMPLIRIRDIKPGFTRTYTTEDFDRKYLVRNNDLLIGMDGEFNLTKWHSGEALMNQRVCRVSSSSEILSDDYLMFFLSSALKQIEERTSFATVKHLSAKVLGSIEVPICSLPEQKAIAKRLITIDDTKTMLARQEGRLIELVKSGFIEMFDGTKTYCCLSDLAETYNGDRGKNYPSANDRGAEGYPFVNAGNLQNGRVSFNEMDYITEEKYLSLSGGKIRKDDILYCLRGSLGKSALSDFDGGTIASSLMIIHADIKKVEPRYLYEALNSPYILEQMRAADNGSSQPNLSAKSVKAYRVAVPDLCEQRRFADFAVQIDKLEFDVRQQIEKLETLKKSLMQEYFG